MQPTLISNFLLLCFSIIRESSTVIKKIIRKQMSSSGKEGLQISDWSEIKIYSINIHISCYELDVGLKYNVIIGRSQPLESEETAGGGFINGCPR